MGVVAPVIEATQEDYGNRSPVQASLGNLVTEEPPAAPCGYQTPRRGLMCLGSVYWGNDHSDTHEVPRKSSSFGELPRG